MADNASKNDPMTGSAVAPTTPVDESGFTTGGTTNSNDAFDPNTPEEVRGQQSGVGGSEADPEDPTAEDIDEMGKAVGMHSGGHAGRPSPLNTAAEVEKAEEAR